MDQPIDQDARYQEGHGVVVLGADVNPLIAFDSSYNERESLPSLPFALFNYYYRCGEGETVAFWVPLCFSLLEHGYDSDGFVAFPTRLKIIYGGMKVQEEHARTDPWSIF